MQYNVKIEPEAISDIQDITDWYNVKKAGLGKRFQDATVKQINGLHKDPHIFAVRYKEIRCMGINKFPYMVHFYINDLASIVEVLAVLSTDRNPKIWKERTAK